MSISAPSGFLPASVRHALQRPVPDHNFASADLPAGADTASPPNVPNPDEESGLAFLAQQASVANDDALPAMSADAASGGVIDLLSLAQNAYASTSKSNDLISVLQGLLTPAA